MKRSHRCDESFLLIMSSTLYFLCKRKNVLSSEFKNNDLCFLSWMIFVLMLTKQTTFAVSWRFRRRVWLIKFKILNCEDEFVIFAINEKSVSLTLKSYVISFEHSSIVTFEALFKLAWINDAALIQFVSKFSVKKNRKTISTIWFVLFDCSSICELICCEHEQFNF